MGIGKENYFLKLSLNINKTFSDIGKELNSPLVSYLLLNIYLLCTTSYITGAINKNIYSSRVLSEITGIGHNTINRIINDLIKLGYLVEYFIVFHDNESNKEFIKKAEIADKKILKIYNINKTRDSKWCSVSVSQRYDSEINCTTAIQQEISKKLTVPQQYNKEKNKNVSVPQRYSKEAKKIKEIPLLIPCKWYKNIRVTRNELIENLVNFNDSNNPQSLYIYKESLYIDSLESLLEKQKNDDLESEEEIKDIDYLTSPHCLEVFSSFGISEKVLDNDDIDLSKFLCYNSAEGNMKTNLGKIHRHIEDAPDINVEREYRRAYNKMFGESVAKIIRRDFDKSFNYESFRKTELVKGDNQIKFDTHLINLILKNQEMNSKSNIKSYLEGGVQLNKDDDGNFYIWRIGDYLDWVSKFHCNPNSSLKRVTPFHYLVGAQQLDNFLYYNNLLLTNTKAPVRERELIDYYYSKFPEDHQFRLQGFKQVVSIMRNLIATGFPWCYFIPIIDRGRELKDTGKDIKIFDFDIYKLKSIFKINFEGNIEPWIIEAAQVYTGVPEDKLYKGFSEDIEDELLHIQKYKSDKSIISDPNWLEKDKQYGYMEYFSGGK